MANVYMPVPVAFAAGALCLLGGFLVGVVAGPSTTNRSTAEVVSYDRRNGQLCLTGEAVADAPETVEGELCGTWQRNAGSSIPQPGDDFRFVTMTSDSGKAGETATFIYGDVLPSNG